MKQVRIFLWLLVALVALGYGYLHFFGSDRHWTEQVGVRIGGSFDLVDQNGNQITDKDILGKPHAMFFGFTHCPEICPTTLFEASGWLKALGDDGDRLGIYFISVDPERDTPEILKDYMSAFDPRITAITGSAEKIAGMIADYKVYAKKVPLDDGDYTMDHTATVFLFNADGTFAKTIAWAENPETVMEKLENLIEKGKS